MKNKNTNDATLKALLKDDKMSDIKAEIVSKHKCLECEHIPCIDFYRKLDKFEGGELYVLESTIKNKAHVPCECGALIYSLCQLLVPISDALSFELFNQCIRDLKAVSFLILTGHYRAAMQIMRPIIENFLTGLYWDVKFLDSDTKTEKIIIKEHEKFREYDRYVVLEEDWNEAFDSISEQYIQIR